jgi:hypothetical protein
MKIEIMGALHRIGPPGMDRHVIATSTYTFWFGLDMVSIICDVLLVFNLLNSLLESSETRHRHFSGGVYTLEDTFFLGFMVKGGGTGPK